jgi:hypothetical protein
MFSQVSVQKSSVEPLRRNEVLHFVIEMKLV